MQTSHPSRALHWLRLATTTSLLSAAPPLAVDTGQTRLAQPQFQAGQVRFDWNSGGELQTAPGPDGPWTTIQAPQEKASTATVPFNPGNLFFRVVDKGIPSEVKAIVGGDARKPFQMRPRRSAKALRPTATRSSRPSLSRARIRSSNFSLLQDGEVVTLRDDGLEGDAKAGDGGFTGLNMPKLDPADHVTPRIFADLKRREDDLLKLITEPCFFQLFKEPAGFTH